MRPTVEFRPSMTDGMGLRTDLTQLRPSMADDPPCMGFRAALTEIRPGMADDSPCLPLKPQNSALKHESSELRSEA